MSIYALGDRRPSFGEGSWIAHNATVIGSVTAGRNVSIWYNVVVRGDNDPITIGDDTNIQDGSVLHNDDRHPARPSVATSPWATWRCCTAARSATAA